MRTNVADIICGCDGKMRRCGCWKSIPFCLLSYSSGLTVIWFFMSLCLIQTWCTLETEIFYFIIEQPTTKHDNVFDEYKIVRNKVKRETVKIVQQEQDKISWDCKSNTKRSWRYVNRKTKNKEHMSDSYNFCSAMLCISASYAVMRCVCVSVCLSRLWIVSKRINIASKFFHHSIFYHAKWHSSIPTGTPPTPMGMSNAGG